MKEIGHSLHFPNITLYYDRAIKAIEEIINEKHQEELQQYLDGEITKDELEATFE